MSDSISSIVEEEKVVCNSTLLQNIQPPSSSQASTPSMCSFTLSSETQISLGLNASRNEFKNAWILDSDATNYMTHNPNHFETYSLYPSNRKIVVVDGTTTTVTGIGVIQVTPNLVIKNVLHIPHISTNLVPIQNLPKI